MVSNIGGSDGCLAVDILVMTLPLPFHLDLVYLGQQSLRCTFCKTVRRNLRELAVIMAHYHKYMRSEGI